MVGGDAVMVHGNLRCDEATSAIEQWRRLLPTITTGLKPASICLRDSARALPQHSTDKGRIFAQTHYNLGQIVTKYLVMFRNILTSSPQRINHDHFVSVVPCIPYAIIQLLKTTPSPICNDCSLVLESTHLDGKKKLLNAQRNRAVFSLLSLDLMRVVCTQVHTVCRNTFCYRDHGFTRKKLPHHQSRRLPQFCHRFTGSPLCRRQQ